MALAEASVRGWFVVLRLIAGLVVFVAVGGMTANAQSTAASSPLPAPPAAGQAPSALGSFELTPSQKAKIDSIGARHASEAKAVQDLFAIDPSEAMRRMVALRARMQKEVRVVLTAEQRAIFDRNMAEINAQMDAHRPAPPR